MEPSQFLEQFGHLADSPGGVGKLRNLILELAMRGQLVPQNPDDEPASELLKRIEAEKKRHFKAGEFKLSKPLPPVTNDEVSYPVPNGWVLVRLGNVLTFEYGKPLPAKSRNNLGSIPVFGSNGIVGLHDKPLISCPAIIVGRKGSAGVINVSTGPCYPVDVTYYVIPPFDLSFNFTVLLLKSIRLERLGNGIVPGLNRNEVYKLAVTLPPLAEQQRIVAKVDELMALCDQLEGEQAARDHLRERATKSTLHHLTDAPTRADARRYWHSAEQNFPHLFDRSATVADLRATILQLAVQGRLVPQNPDDEPASELLRRIEAEKKRHFKAGEFKLSKPLPPVTNDEVSYPVPNGWVWIRAGHIAYVGTGATPLKDNAEYWIDGHIPWVTSSATNQPFVYEPSAYITEKALLETNAEIFPSGSLLVAMYGQGKTRGQVTELLIDTATNQACAALVFHGIANQSKRYIKWFFVNNYEEIRKQAAGGAQPNLNLSIVRDTAIPLPPLAEQERIVAKVDELMALCDQLEAQAEARQALSGRLFDSIVHHMLTPSAVS